MKIFQIGIILFLILSEKRFFKKFVSCITNGSYVRSEITVANSGFAKLLIFLRTETLIFVHSSFSFGETNHTKIAVSPAKPRHVNSNIMRKSKIVRVFISLTLLTFISCSTKIKSESKFDLVSVSSLKEYRLLSFSNGKDTILTVANKNADALCIIDAINEKNGLQRFKKIESFDNAGEKIIF